MAFLSLQRAQKCYGAATALDGVSLEVERGELLALLGPSGSGKSTLLMSIAGFVVLDEGEIVVDGVPISNLPPFKRNFGVVFQQYALFPHMTVEQNVGYPLIVRGITGSSRRSAVGRALDRVQLSHLQARYPDQLSGGQQQRVALARALVFEPTLLLMDEPLGALDRKLRLEMQREIRAIQQDLKITTLYVTHDQDEAMCLADRIAVINGGHIEQIAKPLEMYDHPASAFVANFIGEANLFGGRVADTRDGDATIATSLGCQIEMDRNALRKGETVTVLERPEQVALSPRIDSGIIGVIRQCNYFGSSVRCIVELQGQSIISVVPRHRLSFEPAQGMTVAISWDRDAACILGSEVPHVADVHRRAS
jgi:putative spermidine/putrescine transport system ATP-binding protein